jgi:hypothetical protein
LGSSIFGFVGGAVLATVCVPVVLVSALSPSSLSPDPHGGAA